MRIYTGDEVGLLKEITTDTSSFQVRNLVGKVAPNDAIQHCHWPTKADEMRGASEQEIVYALKGGRLRVINVLSGAVAKDLEGWSGDFAGLDCHNSYITTATSDGHLYNFHLPAESQATLNQLSESIKMKHVSLNKPIEAFAVHPNRSLVAVGGRNLEMQLFDFSQDSFCKPIFRAKNEKVDDVGVPKSVWNKSVVFTDPSTTDLFLVGTAYHQLRLYDQRVQKRAVMDMVLGCHAISTMTMSPDNNTALIANTAGEVHVFDMRQRKSLGLLKGHLGTVTALHCHPTLPVVATGGLDNHGRIYNYRTRTLLIEMYMKQRLSTVLFSSSTENYPDEMEDLNPLGKERLEEDYDAMWNTMPTVGAKKRQKTTEKKRK